MENCRPLALPILLNSVFSSVAAAAAATLGGNEGCGGAAFCSPKNHWALIAGHLSLGQIHN